jgi:ribosomal protein S18 acetylase RimI-like enzyme
MYVRPEARGKAGGGLADAIMARLIEQARQHGLTTLRLETGTQQAAAIRFYKRWGFEQCQPFEPYSSMPPQAIATSLFMQLKKA